MPIADHLSPLSWLLLLGLQNPTPPTAQPAVSSILQTIAVDDKSPQPVTVYTSDAHSEAPNWTHDGRNLLFNQDGKIMRVPVAGGTPQPLDIGAATHCNGSHGLSPDGKLLAISCSTPDLPGSRVYVVPSTGGAPRLVTQNPNSYFHSWSPDGKTILFTRPDHGSINIHSISVNGGEESPLTSPTGTNDDPDFAPDGKHIYFNSDRTGSMQIWRMRPDGSAPEQVTSDDLVNWTPHPSPDGKLIVFLTYQHGTTGHPANQPVMLRLLSLRDGTIRTLTKLTGGAGTINVPSWSPDSRRLAFVSYQLSPTH
jgi:TolB protein